LEGKGGDIRYQPGCPGEDGKGHEDFEQSELDEMDVGGLVDVCLRSFDMD